MPEPKLDSVHIVIQQVRDDSGVRFRVVGYGDRTSFRRSEFESVEDLVRALHSALPRFDESTIVIKELERGETYIAYAGDVALDDSQLLKLGLRRI
jgi:hypothetical protein